jgi:hypothetical protein
MLHQVVSVEWVQGTTIKLLFDDHQAGMLDLSKYVTFDGYLSKLKEEDFFKQVSVNQELGTIFWPHDIDFCPDRLYSWAILSIQ